jgi:histidinol-phosphate aminotransferase
MINPKQAITKLNEYKIQCISRKPFVRLDYNENTSGCSKKVIQKIRKLKPEDYATYPEYEGLNKSISKYCKIKPNEVLATNGSDDAIKLIIDCFIDNNDESIIIEPTFGMYKFYLTVASAKITKLEYNEDLAFPTKNILKNVNKKTKLIVLCNPNNPTGTSIKKQDIIKILEKAKNSVLLVDEAYYEFSKETVKDLINKYSNLIITRTFSKAFGLAGLRAGYIISNKNIINILSKAYSPYALNIIAKTAIEASLKDIEFMKSYRNRVINNKKRIQKEFNKLKIKTYSSKANFILARFNFAKEVSDKLKQSNILVRSWKNDVSILKNCLRITTGDDKQTKKLIYALKKIMKPALIFDMDGVLVDVSNSYRKVIKKTAEYFTKQKISYDEIQSYKNIPGFNNDWNLTEMIIRSRKKRIKKSIIINKFQEYYLGNNAKYFNGLIKNEKWILNNKLLKKLSKQYKLAIVTGRPKIEAEYALKINNTKKYFQVIITKEDVKQEKPDPEGIIKALKLLKIENAVYFGDTINDKIASEKSKVKYIMINNDCVKNNINIILERYLK